MSPICFPFVSSFLDTFLFFRRHVCLCHLFDILTYDAIKMTLMSFVIRAFYNIPYPDNNYDNNVIAYF